MSDETDQTRKRCSVCKAYSPESNTNYTLISAKHAWRMELKRDASGQREPIWFCPKCWEKRKQLAKV